MLAEIRNIFKFRELLFAFLIRGFKAKYKNSFLGIFWSLLNPLLNVLIFAFIFTVIIKIGIKDYPLYLLCAIFAWNFFNSALINSVVSIFENTQFVKNISFPVEIIPLSVVIVNFINFLIDLVILSVLLFFLGKPPVLAWLYLPALLVIELTLVCGLSILLSGSYIIFRDLNFILNLSLRLFFYFVPVIYSLELVPANFKSWYLFNPLAVVIDGFARVLFYGVSPDPKFIFLALLESVVIFILSFGIFQRMKKIIPERL